MGRHSDNNSVFHEPHLRPVLPPDATAVPEAIDPPAGADDEEETVWDEPQFAHAIRPDQRPKSYWHIWRQRTAETSALTRAAFVVKVLMLSAPLAVLVTFLQTIVSQNMSVALVFFGSVLLAPVVEEAAKPLLVAHAVSSRPYIFRRGFEIVAMCALSAFTFAAVENLLYLNVYIPHPDRHIIVWRWTVCVLLHVTCTSITGLGLAREWQRAWRKGRRPRAEYAASWYVAAAVVHGAYNATATLLELFHVL